jgi:fructose-1,6-bisphosphatase/inositol monophosphatase family enzyme
MSTLDVAQVASLVQDVAAQRIVPRFRALADHEVAQKSRGEVVTVADQEAEADLTAALRGLLPDVPMLGEEAASNDVELAARVQAAPRYWLLDPLDGTSNFVAGRPDVGVMLALVDGGQAVASWIWQPLHEQLFVAELGSGAHHNGRRLSLVHAAAGRSPDQMTGYLYTAFFGAADAGVVSAATAGFGHVSRGPRAACIAYPRLAQGQVQFALYGRTHPWDHAPGALLLAEAGGAARRFDGTDYRPGQQRRGLLVTSLAADWAVVAAGLAVADLTMGG